MKRFLVVALASVALFGAGCSHAKKQPKPSKTIAADVEEQFKQRWVAKRMGEITAAEPGIEAREARRRAVDEFRKRFSHTAPAKAADGVGNGIVP